MELRIRAALLALVAVIAVSAPAAAQSPSAAASALPIPSPATEQLMPAGTQFGPVEALPRSLEVTNLATTIAERDGAMVVMGVKRSRQYGPTSVVAALRASEGSWRVVEVDRGKGLRGGPAGSVLTHGIGPSALAAGPKGFVAVGSAALYPAGYNVPGQIVSLIWFSPNGRSWRRIDTRTVVGSRTTFQLSAVSALPGGGFMAAGSLGPLGFKQPSTIVVLTSPDGRTWRKTATIQGRWAVDASRLMPFGDQIVLAGYEIACAADTENQRLGTIGDQARYWVSDERGRAWKPVDTAATGVITSVRPMPTRAKDCPRRGSASAYQKYTEYASSGSIVGVADGLVVAMDGAGSRVATSSDLRTWQVADLPGATPAGDPPPDRHFQSAQVVDDPNGDGIALVTVEDRRTAEDTLDDMALSFLAWRTSDRGTTWQQLPATRPVIDDAFRLDTVLSPDGSMLLVSSDAGSHGTIRRSAPGPLIVAVCEPAPATDCMFQTLSDLDLGGRDLSGIQLTGATLDGVVLDGANLRGADLRGATVQGSLRGADLRDTRLEAATIKADIAGAQLAGTVIDGTYIGGTSADPLDARGVDFREADIEYVSLFHIDLSGARFFRKQGASLSFWSDVTCPDGKPMDETSGATDPCRMGPR